MFPFTFEALTIDTLLTVLVCVIVIAVEFTLMKVGYLSDASLKIIEKFEVLAKDLGLRSPGIDIFKVGGSLVTCFKKPFLIVIF